MPDKMEKTAGPISELVEISRFFGRNKEYVIAGGGNTSYKDKDTIWIKASGTSLADINEEGFVSLSRDKLRKISEKSYSQNPNMREKQVKDDLAEAVIGPEGKRPSVETSMHEIIDYPFIVHTHPTLVNSMLCSKKSKTLSRKILGKKALFIEYTDPGYVLFKKVHDKLKDYRERFSSEPSVILLQNHGIFVSGNTVEEIKSIYSDVENDLKGNISINLPEDKSHYSIEYGRGISREIAGILNLDPSDIAFRTNELITRFLKSEKDFANVSKPFTPDDIVYCKSSYLFTDQTGEKLREQVERFSDNHGYMPKIIGIKGKGLLAIESGSQSPVTVLDVFENMMKVSMLSENFGGPQFMTPEQIDFIDNWEVENYRRTVNG
jgi:rhamnose utilization protein RhaD (predicted bifunctional aldolase and dehydrogenase)